MFILASPRLALCQQPPTTPSSPLPGVQCSVWLRPAEPKCMCSSRMCVPSAQGCHAQQLILAKEEETILHASGCVTEASLACKLQHGKTAAATGLAILSSAKRSATPVPACTCISSSNKCANHDPSCIAHLLHFAPILALPTDIITCCASHPPPVCVEALP